MTRQKNTIVPVSFSRQSNHDRYTLPDELTELGAPPLYLAVAHWGWRLGRPFGREELAVTFGISPLRAGDVMSYIRRRHQTCISSRQHYERPGNGIRLRYLQILAEPVYDPEATVRSRQSENIPQIRQELPLTEAALRELRQWFICR